MRYVPYTVTLFIIASFTEVQTAVATTPIVLHGVPMNNVATVPVVITSCLASKAAVKLSFYNRRPGVINDVTANIVFVRYDRRLRANVTEGSSHSFEVKFLDGYELRTLSSNLSHGNATGMICRLVTLTTGTGHKYTYATDAPVSTADHL
jgi:hypothetical protein